jgi:hypothetical protein
MSRLLVPAVLLSFLLSAGPTLAIDGCKLKVGKDGTIYFNAKNIDIPGGAVLEYHWRTETADSRGRRFSNGPLCVTGGDASLEPITNARAKNCTLGSEGSLRRVVPPDTCSLTVTQYNPVDPTAAAPDDACTVFLKGCTPGARPVCPPDAERVGSFCLETRLRGPGTLPEASALCHAQGRTVCSWQALSQCDHLNIGSCGANTDGPRSDPLWTADTAAEDGDNLFNRILAYEGNETAGSNDAAELNDDQDTGRWHCCQPISGPLDSVDP